MCCAVEEDHHEGIQGRFNPMFARHTPSVTDMLSDIHMETGAQLMSSLLYQTSPLGTIGLPGLDVQFLSTTATRASPTSSLNRGDVLEIQGPAASGKTQLVYHLTMQCILPECVSISKELVPSEVEVGGWGKSAVIMDADGRWSVRRLKVLMIRRLKGALTAKQPDLQQLIEEIVSKSLRRLHVFRVKSSVSLAATLFNLPLYHSRRMADEEIALLAIDSISSFHWIDRYHTEQQRQGSSDRKESANVMSRVLVALQEVRLSHGPVIVLTNWGLIPATKASDVDEESPTPSPFYRQHLDPFPAPFENSPRIVPNAHLMPPITHHITLSLPPVDRVPLSVTSLQEALERTERRSIGVRKGITGILRTVETGYTATFAIEGFE